MEKRVVLPVLPEPLLPEAEHLCSEDVSLGIEEERTQCEDEKRNYYEQVSDVSLQQKSPLQLLYVCCLLLFAIRRVDVVKIYLFCSCR